MMYYELTFRVTEKASGRIERIKYVDTTLASDLDEMGVIADHQDRIIRNNATETLAVSEITRIDEEQYYAGMETRIFESEMGVVL